MTFRITAAPTLTAIAFIASVAGAQQPAAPAIPAVPVPSCVKPEFPGPFSDSRRLDRFNKEAKAYTECLKKYIDDTKALSDASIEAGNNAIKEHNAFVKEVDERAAATKK
jgi:hypothetical protein